LKDILKKFGYNQELSETLKQAVKNFDRENKIFDEITRNAKLIRNNAFEKKPELVASFQSFKQVLEQKIVNRRLYSLQLLSSFHMAFAQNSCNFSVPGSGKTSIVYGAYAYLNSLPEDDPRYVEKLLVIGPLSSFAPWENEYEDCFGKRANSFRMSGDDINTKKIKHQHLYSSNPAEVTLISHGGVNIFKKDIVDFLERHKTMLVVDEAHRIKNPDGVWGRSITEISKAAVARVVLTGTPVPNGYQDIYNLYKFIYPFKFKDILGFHFQNLQDLTKDDSQNNSNVDRLKENISPFFIRIKKSDLNLPPIVEKTIPVNMDTCQREIYDFIESKYVEDFKKNSSGTIKDILNRAKLIRLRQASTNPALLFKPLKDSIDISDVNSNIANNIDEYISDSSFFDKITKYPNVETPQKFKEVLNILNSRIFPNGGKVIIWTIFVQNAKELKDYLNKNRIASRLLIGEIETEEREATIAKFNKVDDEEFKVIIANPFSVGESISLHRGCHNAIYLERDYSCTNFLQSKDRIHRVGLKEGQLTNYFYLISKDSIDEVIEDRLQIKIARMENIINDDIPLFGIVDNNDETDLIKGLIDAYARRS
ncbi:MAG: DEAD/DEAH box helicase, partial [Candidatus Zapsychrus exili]|nr:DEAD/DEAH box helicase [Candidatus Zapsychrus exili]